MAKRVPGAVAVAVLTLTLTAVPARAAAVDFTGAVALSNCSGSVVRTPSAQPSDPALVLTNGHCVRMLDVDEVVVDQPASRMVTLVNREGTGSLRSVRANRLLYATMTGTDAAVYRLGLTYAEVEAAGSRALELSPTRSTAGADIRVVSGYWKTIYSCALDGFVHRLREDQWSWPDAIRYAPECRTKGGTSGSPIVDAGTGQVVGVNNTANENGERCTLNNPCEEDESGAVTVRQGIGYGQQTHQIVPCVKPGAIDLTAPGCTLPRP
ncbi:MAG: trypsin-like peptidase domain-containing protein [Saccharothrix sp.]|nr:trypsin-like peptidase domain-containing protein [Saccharothrix sp.]